MCNSKDEVTPLVTIRCIAYNQVQYIRNCLEGFVSQITTFPFEVIVHDDASTDGTAEIIKEYAQKYPQLIKPFFEDENQWSKNNGVIAKLLQENSKGKYIAYCEGDDYWIDTYKLQKQVDFLEKNSGFVMCYTRFKKSINEELSIEADGGPYTCFVDLLRENTVATLTALYRKDVDDRYFSIISPQEQHWKMGDYPRWLWMSKEGKIGFIEDVTAIYRVLPESASHSKSLQKRLSFIDGEYAIRTFFNSYYHAGMDKVLIKDYYINTMYEISLHGEINIAFKTYLEAIKKNWTLLFNFKLYGYMFRSFKNYIMKQ